MNIIALAVLLSSVPLSIAHRQSPPPHLPSQPTVTAAQVNGTWRDGRNSFEIRALGHQKLRVSFSGAYPYNSPAGPTVNIGEGSGITTIEGNEASFKPEGVAEECQITMKFSGGKLIVSQEGTCGFGNNVMAAGTYHRASRRRTKLKGKRVKNRTSPRVAAARPQYGPNR